MLEFYIIEDSQNTPDWPEQVGLQYAGEIDAKTFKNLKTKGFVEDQFGYYSDFRWNRTFVE